LAKSMTGRERVMAALNHQVPDRTPMDLGGTRDSSIVVEGYERLKAHFGVDSETTLCDRMMRVVHVDEAILTALEIDTRAIFPGAPLRETGERVWVDAWGVERVHPQGSYYYDQRSAPLQGRMTLSDVAGHPWPDPEAPGHVSGLRERLAWIRQNTDAAAILTLPAPFVHISQYLRGFEDWYKDFIVNAAPLETLFDAVLEVTSRIARRQLEEIGREVDIVICADDLGTQWGLQISRDHYLKLIKPRHAAYFRMIHDLTPAKLLFHSCGSLAAIMEDLVEIGVEVINPVQTTAAGMEPAGLKARYGGRLCFWGAMDSQQVLPFGTVEEVERMVEERIEQMGRGGGYVLSSCHNIQPDVSVVDVLAIFERAKTYRPSFA